MPNPTPNTTNTAPTFWQRRLWGKLTVKMAAIILTIAAFAFYWLYESKRLEERTQHAPAPFVEWDIPTNPLDKAAYDEAHALKLPTGKPILSYDEDRKRVNLDRLPEPVPFDFCKKRILGMCFEYATAQEYAEHLCKTEAGEYFFKIPVVEGVLQMRPRYEMTEEEQKSLTKYEDPWGYAAENTGTAHNYYTGYYDKGSPAEGAYPAMPAEYNKGREQFFESLQPPIPFPEEKYYNHEWFDWKSPTRNKKYWHISIVDPKTFKKSIYNLDAPKARYGYTWRGIRRPMDREFGIAGGELLAVDLKTKEVIAVRRGFAMTNQQTNQNDELIYWEYAARCPATAVSIEVWTKEESATYYPSNLLFTKNALPNKASHKDQTRFMEKQEATQPKPAPSSNQEDLVEQYKRYQEQHK